MANKHEKRRLSNEDRTNDKGEKHMAVLAKPSNKMVVIRVEDKKKFVENFNNSKPSKEFMESCKKAGRLFGLKK